MVESLEDRTLLNASFAPTVFTDGVSGGSAVNTLRDAIIAANNDTTGGTDTINLAAGTYTLNIANTAGSHESASAQGDLNITSTNHTLVIVGATNTNGTAATIVDQTALDRVFQIVAPGTTVEFKNLIIEGGDAQDNGVSGALAGKTAAQGGGLLNNGGNVTMTNVVFQNNRAAAGAGQNAQGGGVYSTGGNLTLNQVTIGVAGANNQANAGASGPGLAAGNAQGGGLFVSGGTATLNACNIVDNGAKGATAFSNGNGGNAQGGGIYATGVTLTLTGGSLQGSATGGRGAPGVNGVASKAAGGNGGQGGLAQGGGVYAKGGSLTLASGVSVLGSTVTGGNGRFGGVGYNAGGVFGVGGAGGAGGNAAGGGVYASNTTVNVTGASINTDSVFGGAGSSGGTGGQGMQGGLGGAGGLAQGGGLFVNGGSQVTITGSTTTIHDNSATGGLGGLGGKGGLLAVAGSTGGAGGEADGGALYVNAAPLTINGGAVIQSNTARGGIGGQGGFGGAGTTLHLSGIGGGGGVGGLGGQAQGAGVFVTGSNLAVLFGAGGTTPSTATIQGNVADGGNGGAGGTGGVGVGSKGIGGAGGAAAAGGNATGGGATVIGDTLTLTNAIVNLNQSEGGIGGTGGFGSSGGAGQVGGAGAAGGNGGTGQGAGLFVSGSTKTTILNSSISRNIANVSSGGTGGRGVKGGRNGIGGNGETEQGGGLYAASSTVTALNSTLADNLIVAGTGGASGAGGRGVGQLGGNGNAQGGGIFAVNGSLTLINDTIAWNFLHPVSSLAAFSGGQGVGVYNDVSNTLKMENTIIALNQLFLTGSSTATPSDLFGTAASSDHDFIGDGSGSNLTNGTNGDQVGTDAAPLDPVFLPAQTSSLQGVGQYVGMYGGLTPTLPLNWSSRAINAGDPSAAAAIATAEGVAANTATDQRGFPRVIDGTMEIGATETQLILNGSAPATVAAGGTITYTLTVTNNETTATGVTLSDTIPANTTYVSMTVPIGWSAPLVSGNTVTTSISSLAPGATATFTLTVAVASNAPGGTNLVNNASITTTGNAVAFTRSVSESTNIPGSTTTDITSEVKNYHTPIIPIGGVSFQGGLLINNSGQTLTGPIALVLTGLPAGVTLANATGTFNGSPYIDIVPPGGSWKSGWANFLLYFLEFNNPNHVKITYTAEVIQGI